MPHNVSPAFQAAAIAPVNDVASDVLIGWQKQVDASATFFELGISDLDGGDFLKGSGDDVTFFDRYRYESEIDNVESWEVTRTSSLYPYGVFMSQADVTLDNTSKRYLPGYDPDIGDFIKPRRPLMVYAGFDNEQVQQFVGFSDIPKNTIENRKTKLHAFDVMDYFDSVETDINYFQGEYWHDIVEALLIEQGFTASQYELDVSLQFPIGYMPTTGMSVGDIFRKGCEAEQGVMFADENGIIRFWNRLHFSLNRDTAKVMSYDTVTDIEYQDTPIINYVRVTALPRAVSALQKIWQNSSSIKIPASSSEIVSVKFEDEFGSMPVTTAHSPVFINLQDDTHKSYYNTNTESDGTGDVASSNITMSDFNLVGDVAFIEFTNSSGSDMYITDLQIYGTPAKVTSPVEEEYKDQQSIDDYGINPHNNGEVIIINNDWVQDQGTAFAHAFNLVTEYADGNQQLLVKPFADPSLKFGDVVEIMVDDVDDEPHTAVVLGTKLKSSIGDTLSQELIVDIRNLVSYFTLDVSQLDGTDVLAA